MKRHRGRLIDGNRGFHGEWQSRRECGNRGVVSERSRNVQRCLSVPRSAALFGTIVIVVTVFLLAVISSRLLLILVFILIALLSPRTFVLIIVIAASSPTRPFVLLVLFLIV